MSQQVLLGCVTTSLQDALGVAAILSRSHVGVSLHPGIPTLSAARNQLSPFQVIFLSDPIEQIDATLQWLVQHDTQRYLYAFETPLSSETSRGIGRIANELLSTLADQGIVTAAHLVSPSDAMLLKSELERVHKLHYHESGEHEPGDAEEEPSELRHVLNSLRSEQSTHVLTRCNDQHDLLNYTRATESVRLLCGDPLVATHLPALFRIRGWLNSDHQKLPIKPPAGCQIVIGGSHLTTQTTQTTQFDNFTTPAQQIIVDAEHIQLPDTQQELQIRLAESLASSGESATPYSSAKQTQTQRLFIKIDNNSREEINRQAEIIVAGLLADIVNAGICHVLIYGTSQAIAFLQAVGIEYLDVSDELACGVAWMHGSVNGNVLSMAVVHEAQQNEQFLNHAFKILCEPERNCLV